MSQLELTTFRLEYRLVKEDERYRVGTDGSVWSRCRGNEWRLLKPNTLKSGHQTVCIGRKNHRYVHVLVLEAFDGPCPPGLESRHLDGNPANNRIDNLIWGTREENAGDKILHGTANGCGRKVLTDQQVLDVVAMRKDGIPIVEIAASLNVHDRTIQAILYGRSRNEVTGIPKYAPKNPRKPAAAMPTTTDQ